jgi:hypothetical protein
MRPPARVASAAPSRTLPAHALPAVRCSTHDFAPPARILTSEFRRRFPGSIFGHPRHALVEDRGGAGRCATPCVQHPDTEPQPHVRFAAREQVTLARPIRPRRSRPGRSRGVRITHRFGIAPDMSTRRPTRSSSRCAQRLFQLHPRLLPCPNPHRSPLPFHPSNSPGGKPCAVPKHWHRPKVDTKHWYRPKVVCVQTGTLAQTLGCGGVFKLAMPLCRHKGTGVSRPGATGRSQRPAAVGRAGCLTVRQDEGPP